uniref:KTx n=1 Tax=Tityus melici TaxID=3026321 RepID=A0AA49K9Q6_9SCOR|nr:putative KTx [Tityus melici]
MKLSCGFLLILLVLSAMIATFSEVEAMKPSKPKCGLCKYRCCSGGCSSGKCVNGACDCSGRSDLNDELEKYQ